MASSNALAIATIMWRGASCAICKAQFRFLAERASDHLPIVAELEI